VRILSWNVNGIRAVVRKGLLDWLARDRPDVLCLQEIKARPEQVPPPARAPESYHVEWHPAQRPGYSGTATWSRIPPSAVARDFGVARFADEGRVLVTTHGDVELYNVYFPNGKSGLKRLQYKLRFYDSLLEHLVAEREAGKKLLVGGDYNTAHKPIDLAHPGQNKRISGFLVEERAWLDRLVEAGFVDTFRQFHPDEKEQYTWWSPLTKARERNVGWRIDYFFASDNLVSRVKDAFILPDVQGSDHCPVGVELD